MKKLTIEQYNKLIDCEVLRDDNTYAKHKFVSRGRKSVNIAILMNDNTILIVNYPCNRIKVNDMVLEYIPSCSFTNSKNPFKTKQKVITNQQEARPSYDMKECLDCVNVSNESLIDLSNYLNLINELSITASKNTHYEKLDEWSTLVYDYIHKMLNKYGFVQAVQEQNPDAEFWWCLYGLLSNIIYSPNLITEVSNHHSSAFERNEALKLDLEYLLNKIKS